MKVTPAKDKFGKYKAGQVFELPDQVARLFIKKGKLRQADAVEPASVATTYQTRMMQAAPAVASVDASAPYGYKADGTPRKRPAPAPRKAE